MSWSWFCECVSRVCGWFSVGDEDWFWVGGVERGCGSLFLSSIFFPNSNHSATNCIISKKVEGLT